jgi:hypothetical protein
MPDQDESVESREQDLALFALVCLAAVRVGGLEQPELLRIDEAVRGLQLLAERDDVLPFDADDAAARMAVLWERYGPAGRPFRPEWTAMLRSEQRGLGDALALATATVNYWQRGSDR